jgi:O-acetyl-ADP-ribose deacetylase (regulator of RNase III)
VASENAITSIAFPSVSTGIYGFPIEKACLIAVSTTRAFLAKGTAITEVVFCCFSPGDLQQYHEVLS